MATQTLVSPTFPAAFTLLNAFGPDSPFPIALTAILPLGYHDECGIRPLDNFLKMLTSEKLLRLNKKLST